MLLLIILNTIFSFLFIQSFSRFFGFKGAAIFLVINICFNLFLIFILFQNILLTGHFYTLFLGNWFNSGNFLIDWSFIIDDLTILMLIIVNLISSIVHIYSVEYMGNDPHFLRFMGYLTLFTFFMIILITADNFIQLFLGWEGVGLCSYLLINFWFTRIQANKSALKAVIVNRISDFGLSFGIIILFYFFLSADFIIPFILQNFFNKKTIFFFSHNFEIFITTFLTFFLFIGAVGKSAQIFLHTWLPDAMEGPTPVSALIHAATMVTAGVFLIIKCSSFFTFNYTILILISFWGAVTSIFAASSGLFLSDIKKVIAYSTCSQLGYMILIGGFLSFNLSLFHLFNHAIFKAALFLCAGAIIHSLSNEQDLRRMGSLAKILPISYITMFISNLAIIGFPFLTGFFSKDIIFEIVYNTYGTQNFLVFWLISLTAIFTTIYSFRLFYLIFIIKTNSFRFYIKKSHESSFLMGFSLLFLSFGSIFFGFIFKDLVIGLGNTFLVTNYIQDIQIINFFDSEFLPTKIKIIPLFLGIFGVIFLYFYFQMSQFFLYFYTRYWNFLINFLINKWYFDFIYNSYLVLPFFYLMRFWFYKNIDKGLLEFIGPYGFWIKTTFIQKNLIKIQTGSTPLYVFIYGISLFIILYLIKVDFFFFNFSLFLMYFTVDKKESIKDFLKKYMDLEKLYFFYNQNRFLFYQVQNESIEEYLHYREEFLDETGKWDSYTFEMESDEEWQWGDDDCYFEDTWFDFQWELWLEFTVYDFIWFKSFFAFSYQYWPKITLFFHFHFIFIFLFLNIFIWFFIKIKFAALYYFLIWFCFLEVGKLIAFISVSTGIYWFLTLFILVLFAFFLWGSLFFYIWYYLYGTLYKKLRVSLYFGTYQRQDFLLILFNLIFVFFLFFFSFFFFSIFWEYFNTTCNSIQPRKLGVHAKASVYDVFSYEWKYTCNIADWRRRDKRHYRSIARAEETLEAIRKQFGVKKKIYKRQKKYEWTPEYDYFVKFRYPEKEVKKYFDSLLSHNTFENLTLRSINNNENLTQEQKQYALEHLQEVSNKAFAELKFRKLLEFYERKIPVYPFFDPRTEKKSDNLDPYRHRYYDPSIYMKHKEESYYYWKLTKPSHLITPKTVENDLNKNLEYIPVYFKYYFLYYKQKSLEIFSKYFSNVYNFEKEHLNFFHKRSNLIKMKKKTSIPFKYYYENKSFFKKTKGLKKKYFFFKKKPFYMEEAFWGNDKLKIIETPHFNTTFRKAINEKNFIMDYWKGLYDFHHSIKKSPVFIFCVDGYTRKLWQKNKFTRELKYLMFDEIPTTFFHVYLSKNLSSQLNSYAKYNSFFDLTYFTNLKLTYFNIIKSLQKPYVNLPVFSLNSFMYFFSWTIWVIMLRKHWSDRYYPIGILNNENDDDEANSEDFETPFDYVEYEEEENTNIDYLHFYDLNYGFKVVFSFLFFFFFFQIFFPKILLVFFIIIALILIYMMWYRTPNPRVGNENYYDWMDAYVTTRKKTHFQEMLFQLLLNVLKIFKIELAFFGVISFQEAIELVEHNMELDSERIGMPISAFNPEDCVSKFLDEETIIRQPSCVEFVYGFTKMQIRRFHNFHATIIFHQFLKFLIKFFFIFLEQINFLIFEKFYISIKFFYICSFKKIKIFVFIKNFLMSFLIKILNLLLLTKDLNNKKYIGIKTTYIFFLSKINSGKTLIFKIYYLYILFYSYKIWNFFLKVFFRIFYFLSNFFKSFFFFKKNIILFVLYIRLKKIIIYFEILKNFLLLFYIYSLFLDFFFFQRLKLKIFVQFIVFFLISFFNIKNLK